jgi:hypothetical protein
MSFPTFYTLSTHALMRDEKNGIVPKQFAEEGQKRWSQFSNVLTSPILLDLAIQAAAIAYPIPFVLLSSLPDNNEPSR